MQHAPDYDTPVIFNRFSSTDAFLIEFAFFNASNTFNHNIFTVVRRAM